MKKLNIIYLLLCVLLWACTEDAPNPALPDVANIPEVPIKVFSVSTPETGTSLSIKPSSATVLFEWSAAQDAQTYEWLLDNVDGDFSAPLITVPSGNEGTDLQLSLTYTELFHLLGDAGVEEGATLKAKWTVRAKSGANVRLAQSAKGITIQRGGVTFTIHVPENTPSDYDVYLAGEFSFLQGASNWQQPGTNSKLKMTKDSNGTYSIVLGVPNGTTFAYKYFIVPTGTSTWSNGERYPNADGMGTMAAPDRSFTYNGTNDNKVEVVSFWEGFDYPYFVYNLTAPENTPVDKDVFIAGEMTKFGLAANWQRPGSNSRLTMTRKSNTEFFIVFPLPAPTTIKYKYAVSVLSANGSWDNEQIPSGDRTFVYDGDNPFANDIVTQWKGF